MQQLSQILFVILLSGCFQFNQTSSFPGFWEGPHPEDPNKKFYIKIDNRNDTLSAIGYWTQNNFYQSRFEVNHIVLIEDSIKFSVPGWECTFSGILKGTGEIRGGFECKGEPFDSVRLKKADWIADYLIYAKPNCKNPDFKYQYKIPDLLNDSIETAGFQSSNDSSFIISVVSEIISGEYGRINSFLLFKNNKLICEEYFYGYSQTDVHQIESCTKSITSLLIGIALDKGYITNIDQPIFEIFPEFQHLNTKDYKNITLEHLLTMTSGFDPQNEQLFQSENRIDFALKRKMVEVPGVRFQYDGGNTEILGAILKLKTGMYPDDFAKKYLFEPLKIKTYKWDGYKQDRFPLMAGSLCLMPRDMIKTGLLILNKGSFCKQQIISKSWIEQSTSVKTKTHIPGDDYSYQWWNLHLKSNAKNYETIWANGWGSQFIYIMPEINVVIVTTGHNYEFDSWAVTDGISKYLYLLDTNK